MERSGSPVLVLGSTGYVGGRLVPLLLERGFRVRAAGRSLEKIRSRPWGRHPNLEPVVADALDEASLTEAMRGCRAAYYLVHSMRPGARDFAALDRKAACNMVRAAKASGLARIIYLSGLGDDSARLSEHLRSRHEVGELLALGPAAVTQLRAAMILGSGSASFEILRHLCERLPFMLTPRWVDTKCQPAAISNVLEYLAGCLEHEETAGRTYEIGGPDVLSYRELFRLYAEVAGIRPPLILALPVLTPRLSAWWVNLVTPVPAALVRPLVEGLANEVVCRDERIRELLPQELLSCREAIATALDRTRQNAVPSCCFDAGSACLPEWAACGDAPYAGGAVFRTTYSVTLAGTPEQAWEVVARIGGDTGWYFGDLLWRLRALMDKLAGGPGFTRGRRSAETPAVGDHLDFWRVLAVDPPRRLLLLAEMRLPGEALLEFRIERQESGPTRLSMTPSFLPRGLWGLAYWWAFYPSHAFLFKNMLRHMARAAGLRVLSGPEAV
ncbi:SDR family oxidoreductase [Desulfovibrio aminophilus]|nr:SDR family oxidoreductase [Desulfovibrio aminophilus]MCM0756548.1 SDR family oxidoreductase [Desulfovibrio aminophilus]